MKKIIIKKMITNNNYFDRELYVDLCEKKAWRYFARWKIYAKIARNTKKFLKIFDKKEKIIIKKHALEMMSEAFKPINFFSKLKYKFKK